MGRVTVVDLCRPRRTPEGGVQPADLRRVLALTLLLMTLAFLGAACGGSEDAASDDSAAEQPVQVDDAQPTGIGNCLDQWNTVPNYELWLNQGAFDSADNALLMVGENGNCLMAACAGGTICLVFSSPCMSGGDALGTAYCPVPGGAIPPDQLAQFDPVSVRINADGTLSA